MAVESTLVLVKPDGVQRGLCGEIISRFERTGLRISGVKLIMIGREEAGEHYAEHRGKSFFSGMIDYLTAGPILAMTLEGPNAIAVVRKIMGSTRPEEAATGTIRGDLALHIGKNLIHGSEHEFDAKVEIERFFADEALYGWDWGTDQSAA